MKKYIFSAIALMIIFSACKKEAAVHKITTTPVTFNVGFSQSTGTYDVAGQTGKIALHALADATTDSTLVKNASIMYIAVYQSDGTRIFLTKQLATDSTFGKANYNLPAGNYTVAFVAGQKMLLFNGQDLSSDNLYYNSTLPLANTPDYSWHDTFFQKINLTVGNTAMSQNVTLKRIDAEVTVDIEDATPSNVKFISVVARDSLFGGEAYNQVPRFVINTSSATGDPGDVFASTSTTIAVAPGTTHTKLSFITLNSAKPYTIELTAYDQFPLNAQLYVAGNTIAYAKIKNVTVQPGHQTILTGKLFGGNGINNTGGFQMKIDSTWDPTPITVPFQ